MQGSLILSFQPRPAPPPTPVEPVRAKRRPSAGTWWRADILPGDAIVRVFVPDLELRVAAAGVVQSTSAPEVGVHTAAPDVRAKVVLVDGPFQRGNPVTVEVSVDHEPAEVFFSYLTVPGVLKDGRIVIDRNAPSSEVPIVDDGLGQPTSRISHDADGTYSYKFDTTGWSTCVVQWHCWGVEASGEPAFSKFGEFSVDGGAPPQLL